MGSPFPVFPKAPRGVLPQKPQPQTLIGGLRLWWRKYCEARRGQDLQQLVAAVGLWPKGLGRSLAAVLALWLVGSIPVDRL